MHTLKRVSGLTAALVLIGLGLFAELRAADAGKTNVTVEVLIFSGRPNPTWQLQDTNMLHALKSKLNDLPVATKQEPAEWSRLGFGGFLIRGGEAVGLPGELRIYQGIIQTDRGKAAKYRKDAQALEQLLIKESKEQALPAPVREAIERYEQSRKP